MASCLILGGAGFIGSHLAEALLRAGHRTRIFDRPHVDSLRFVPQSAACEVLTGDFLNPEDLARAMHGAEVVFHLVSTTLPKGSNDNPIYDVETNVIGTLRMLQLCRPCGVGKVVFMSSGGTVYGWPESLPIREAHRTLPVCAYGIHKLMIEKYLHLGSVLHGLDYCVLRAANAYGERQRTDTAQGAVTVFLERALRGETITIWGDGSAVRDYIYVGDVVAALVKALAYRGPTKTFNIGTGVGVSLNQLVQEIGAVLGRAPAVEYAAARQFDVPANVLDSSLALQVLGWRAEMPLAEGIRRTCNWLRSAR
jgi:UDP-glucose 4-epimerase